MTVRAILFTSLLTMQPFFALAAEQYTCTHVSDDGNGTYQLVTDEYVELTLDGDAVRSRIHISGASKDLTFTTCRDLTDDGSNFNRWFAKECRQLASTDGSPYTIEAFLIGVYAGISPRIDTDYDMHATLAGIGETLGTGIPLRTFVIYASRKPQYEFFCYPERTSD
jgi:hypothetical protein